jgi:hypothetical protein
MTRWGSRAWIFRNVDAEGADFEIGHGGLLSVDRASL